MQMTQTPRRCNPTVAENEKATNRWWLVIYIDGAQERTRTSTMLLAST